ncbi:putative disease resistance protein RGA3 [Hevea brasiliensis]|nr:putative disease resistance protein RGA3 [Hevea brasiliensis]XP_058010301.1 putative disease resistance protein RGA3 [Hevea brasiliensis]XP_058010302.1 putative disease resistance protein RGA3 [Hevea brasiliensis]XP_058010303.1 putative disease resistance protein RGA3 [Hevea brasiliensis]XP_058010304.1 putative disease resistance protein RGA3 [Hevea brasiliensis]
MMRSKISESEWLSVLENDVWKLLESKSDIGPVLKLSYDHLSNYSRQCFAFCAMFPKDYEFDKERLIQLWIAQGYIQSWSTQGGNESLEKIGDRYFNELLFRSFFQRDKYCYKMHDLIHDLARSIAGDSCFMANDNANYIPDGVQHLYFEGLPSDECLRQLKYKGLRTLFFSKLPRGLDISFDNVISHCRSLRALSLCESNINKLTNSIGKLKHLRYLEISGNQDIKSLPNCVSSLYNLHTVILRNCQELRELLTNIRKLICLRHLLIDQCHSLECMPVGLGRLTSLQRLPTFIVGTNQRRRCSTLNELNSLNQLRGDISIKGLRHVKSIALESNKVNLKEKKHLRSLNFDWQGMRDSHFRSLILVENRDSEDIELLLDNLQPHPNLKELSVGYYEGVKISNWLSSIANIVKIDIEWCPKCEHLPRLEHLPSLEYLSLRSFHSLEYISDKKSFSSAASTTTFFPSLKILILRNCPNLKGWWRTWRDAELVPQFPCLSELTIFNCPKLSLMPTFPSLDKKLWLSNANKRPLHQTLNVTATASTLPSMSSFPSSVTTPLSKLQSLILRDVEDLASLPKEWMQNLTSLENLTIRFCKELSDEEDLLSLHGVTKLRCLYIENCSNSTALLDWIGNITSIENLEINDCPNLASLPKGMRQITTLQEMSIAGCPQLSVRCSNHMAADWPNISHIPNIRIDYRYIQKGGRYLLS